MTKAISKVERIAAMDFMNREGFAFKAPHCFFDDVCSEGVQDAEPVFGFIAERLESLARAYRMQRPI